MGDQQHRLVSLDLFELALERDVTFEIESPARFVEKEDPLFLKIGAG